LDYIFLCALLLLKKEKTNIETHEIILIANNIMAPIPIDGIWLEKIYLVDITSAKCINAGNPIALLIKNKRIKT